MSQSNSTACPSSADIMLAEIYALIDQEPGSSPADQLLAEVHRLCSGNADDTDVDPFNNWLAALHLEAPAPPGHSNYRSNPQPLLTMKEAAKFLGFTSTRSLENLRHRKLGPTAIKLPSGGVRFDTEDLKRWATLKDHEAAERLAWRSHDEHRLRQRRQAQDQARHLERKGPKQG